MKKLFSGLLMASLFAPAMTGVAMAEENVVAGSNTTTPVEKVTSATAEKISEPVNMADVSYCIGISFGKSMHGQKIDIDLSAFQQGMQAGFEGTEGKFSESEIRDVMMQFQTSLIEKQIETEQQASESSIEKEKKFLDENKKKDGISATESGLQYRVIESGQGPQPAAADLVTVHYRGTLTDGTVFDSSYDRGEPVTFPLNRVIAGWSEALQLMREGDKWELYIPSTLAYGQRGAGGRIGPNETLVFEVELIKVQSAESGVDNQEDVG